MRIQGLTLVAAICAGVAACPTPAAAQRAPAVADVIVSPADAQVQVSKTTQFFATAYDRGNNALTSVTTFAWRSSNPHVATVDENGVATGVSRGVTLITARYGAGRTLKTSQPATLEVLGEGAAPQPQAQPSAAAAPPPAPRGGAATHATGAGCSAIGREPAGSGAAEGLFVSPLRVLLVKGESKQLEFRAVRGDGGNAEPVCILFSIDPGGERIAQVDSTGVVTSVQDTGHAMVRAVVPGNTRWPPKQIAVEVRPDSVRFNLREVSLPPGTTDTLELVVPAQDNRQLESQMFQFLTSDSTKVRVSPVAAIVTAVAPGSARITASNSLYPDITAVVNVHRPIVRLAATPPDTLITLAIQGTTTMGARFYAADSTQVEGVAVRWTLPDSTVARFDTATGVLRGLKMGDTRIIASALANRTDSIYRAWHVRVVAGGLQIATPRFAMPLGGQAPLAVQLLDDHRRPLGPATGLTWRSSADSLVRVADGRATAVGLGHAQLVARATWDSTVAADAYVVGDLLVPAVRAGVWDLLMVQRDPLRVRALTQDSALETQMAWSPDWTRIAYVAAPPRSEEFDLYVANADGSDVHRLTRDSVPAQAPVFVGPAGDQLVFGSGRTGKTQLFLINRDGTGRRLIPTGEGPATQPDVAPDGKHLLYVSLRERNYNIYQNTLDGTGPEQRLTTGRAEDSPAYAPDGKSFYYLRLEPGSPPSKRVYSQDLATGAATPITPAGVFVQAFSVSADGRTLAILVLPQDTQSAPHVELFDRVSATRTPFVIPGVDRMAAPAFRPAAPH